MSHPLQRTAVVLGLTLASLSTAWSQNAVTAAAAKEAGAVVTPSGLVYRSLKDGAGAVLDKACRVTVGLEGLTLSGNAASEALGKLGWNVLLRARLPSSPPRAAHAPPRTPPARGSGLLRRLLAPADAAEAPSPRLTRRTVVSLRPLARHVARGSAAHQGLLPRRCAPRGVAPCAPHALKCCSFSRRGVPGRGPLFQVAGSRL